MAKEVPAHVLAIRVSWSQCVFFLTKQNSPEDCECIENVISGNPDFIYTEGFLEKELGLEAGHHLGD